MTSKGQVTIPKKIREALDIRQGDVLRLDIEGDHAILTKLIVDHDAEMKALEATLGEWLSNADEEAYRDL
jgi:AbrB family looped-hinge helix DNA binding protein